jgi:hypothetical protein
MIVGYEQAFTDSEEGIDEASAKREVVKVALRSALRRKFNLRWSGSARRLAHAPLGL